MFRNACGRSNDTESWGQCNFSFCKSAFLRLNKKKIKMLTEIVTVCTGELTGMDSKRLDLQLPFQRWGQGSWSDHLQFLQWKFVSPDNPEPQ